MSPSIPENDLLEAVRASSSDTRARLLRALLVDYVQRDGLWPMPVPDQTDEVVAFLFPRPGSTRLPPKVSPEREAELNERLKHFDQSRDLRDYIAKLASPGGSS